MVPKLNSTQRPDDIPQVGIWHHNNAIYFYGNGPVSWEWDENKSMFIHQLHYWSTQAYYFITDGSTTLKNIATKENINESATQTITHYNYRDYHETESYNLIASGRKWFGETFQAENSKHTFSFPSPNRDQSFPIYIAASVAGRSANTNSFTFTINNESSPSLTLSVSSLSLSNNDSYYAKEKSGFSNTTVNGNDIEIEVNYTDQAINAKGWLDYITINSRNFLQLADNELLFRDTQTMGSDEVVKFEISNATSSTVVWDVTDITTPIKIPGSISGNTLSFNAYNNELKEYIAFNPSEEIPIPTFVETIENQNIHAIDKADYIIIAPEQFWSQAHELAELHQTYNNLNSVIVSPTQIYNEFSWGHTDPTAIRSFLRMLYEKSGSNSEYAPKYLLLFGHGSYDSKTNDEDKKSLIVTYQSENSIHYTNSYVTDDYFGFLDSNEGQDDRNDRMDIGIGRFPVRNVEEASIAVKKVRNYLENQDTGNWRRSITFLADDGDSEIHMRDADNLAEILENNYSFDIKKIYLDSYSKTSSTKGDRSPYAQDLVERTIQDGTLLFNYVGHGSTNSLTAEQVITASTLSKWTNLKRLPLFVTATCEFSRYDDPTKVSAGELLFLNENGGGIALLTTTRIVYASLNYQLNYSFINRVFEPDETGQRPSLGNIMMNTKNNSGSSVNKLNFSLLGDPALKMIYPEASVNTLAINHKSVELETDTIKALSKTHIKGEICDEQGNKINDFNGQVDVIVYDKAQEITTLGNGDNSPFTYNQYANILFKGIATATNGEFELEFIVPYDIRYSYSQGKISYYASSESSGDAMGSFKDFIVGGYNNDAQNDNQGPDIELYLNHEDFLSGDQTGSSPLLYASIFDSLGINTSGNGIGHDITLIINEDYNNPIILNEYFQAKPDDFREGMVIYQLPVLEPGNYELIVKAWDNFNNSSSKSISFVVDSSSELKIRNFSWFPNPVTNSSSGYFSFNIDDPGIALTIEAEAISSNGSITGKQIIETVANGNSINPQPLSIKNIGISSPGMYLIRFIVKGDNGKTTQILSKVLVKP